jgi:hypothetical protein
MADRWPLANGNWSNAANWNGGTLPDVGDDVFADGKTVTIDQDVTVLSIRNTQRTGGTANGGFNFSTAQTTYNITADLLAFNQTLISCNQTNRTYNFIGNVSGGTGATNSINCIATGAASININITGNITSQGQGIVRSGILVNQLNVTLTVIGNVSGGGNIGGSTLSGILLSSSTTILNITGNVTAEGNRAIGSIGQNNAGVNINNVNNNITVTGNALTNTTQLSGAAINWITNTFTGNTLTVNGDAVGKHGFSTIAGCIVVQGSPNSIFIKKAIGSDNGTGAAINNDTASNVIVETLEYSNIGTSPVFGKVLFSATNFSLIGKDENSNTVIFTEDNNVGTFIPAETDVRLNTTYYDGNRVGSLNVPDPSNVRNGVPTDNTVGTADLTAQDFFDAIASSSDPIAIRLRNVATVETTGDQISAFNV